MNVRPKMNNINMTPKSLFVALELPVNSFQMKTPQRAAIIGAPLNVYDTLVTVDTVSLLATSIGNVKLCKEIFTVSYASFS